MWVLTPLQCTFWHRAIISCVRPSRGKKLWEKPILPQVDHRPEESKKFIQNSILFENFACRRRAKTCVFPCRFFEKLKVIECIFNKRLQNINILLKERHEIR